MNRVSIEVENLRKLLGVNQALAGLSTTFESGLIHGVIGPEGAGKTTLLRHLLGLLAADHGTIRYKAGGQDVRFAELRPEMAYMPQTQSLYPDLSISEHLDFFSDLYGISADIYKAKRAELLAITRLEPFQDRPAGKLSGGMYKKLGLMCALLQAPSVVLLDEPTNGVDPISRREFWELLYRLTEQNILIIVTTSYMDEAERCGHVHLLDRGRVLADGEPKRLLHEHAVQNVEQLFIKLTGQLASNGAAP